MRGAWFINKLDCQQTSLHSYKVRNKNLTHIIYEGKGETSVTITNYITQTFDAESIVLSFSNFPCFYDHEEFSCKVHLTATELTYMYSVLHS